MAGNVPKASQVVVLAEDERHQMLVRRYLYRLGYSVHSLRLVELPSARGSGEQWVRDRYAKEVKAYRARSARALTALVVVIDADTGDVTRRLRQLNESLDNAALAGRMIGETIAHLIPKRSIETWILCLSDLNVDEINDYRDEAGIDERIPPAALKLFAWSRPGATISTHCVPSLLAAIPEVQRLT